MTALAAMKQALEALEKNIDNMECHFDFYFEAITALRAAIEAVEKAEPVAWMQSNHLHKLAKRHPGSSMMLARCSDHKAMSDFVPLYTHPEGEK